MLLLLCFLCPPIDVCLHRALYFTAYSQAKQIYNRVFSYESPFVHLASAISAGMYIIYNSVRTIHMCSFQIVTFLP